jgi:RHH-type transcriptional regulator, rel operon repressor / antitoxin RelB
MLAVRLPENIEKRLGNLAEKTGRTKTFYVRQAILQHLDDMEDYYLAVDRLKNDDVIFSQEEVEEELGISN